MPEFRTDGGECSGGARSTSELRSDGGERTGGRIDAEEIRRGFDLEELRRRNLSAVAIDVLYLFTTAFFATLFVRGFWPAVIAALPLGTLLYFAWRSTTAFLVAQLLVIAITIVATELGMLPL